MSSNFILRVVCIRKALRREFELRAAALDITAAQLPVLKRLWEGDGITTALLTQDASSDGGTLTGILDRLEKKNLIRRERSQQDRRAVKIWLTDAGRALEAPLTNIIQEINRQAMNGLSAKQQEQLVAIMEKVEKNLNG